VREGRSSDSGVSDFRIPYLCGRGSSYFSKGGEHSTNSPHNDQIIFLVLSTNLIQAFLYNKMENTFLYVLTCQIIPSDVSELFSPGYFTLMWHSKK